MSLAPQGCCRGDAKWRRPATRLCMVSKSPDVFHARSCGAPALALWRTLLSLLTAIMPVTTSTLHTRYGRQQQCNDRYTRLLQEITL
jgi:hypothetical protein